MKYMISKNRTTEYVSSFVNDFLASTSQGMTTLVKKDNRDGRMVVVRCDYSINILREHIAKDRVYPTWMSFIDMASENKQELYYTPNTFFGKRCVANVCSLRAFYLDIDCHDADNFTESAVEYLKNYLTDVFTHDEMPMPSFVFTGRGIHLVWQIHHIEPNRLPYWNAVQQELATYINSALESSLVAGLWEVDKNSLDAARILRLPGTYNHKAGTWCQFLSYSPIVSKLCTFTEFFNIGKVIREKIMLTSPVSRYEGLVKVGELRCWDMEGLRNTFLNICGSDLTLSGATPTQVYNELEEVNARFSKPLSSTQIRAIAKCSSTHGYRYSASGIAERLGLTPDEEDAIGLSKQKHNYSPTVRKAMGFAIARSSGVDTRIINRRKKELAVIKKIRKVEKYSRIREMYRRGMHCGDIAKELEVSIRTVRSYLHKTPEEIEKAFFPDGMPELKNVRKYVQDRYDHDGRLKKAPASNNDASAQSPAPVSEPAEDPAPAAEPDSVPDNSDSPKDNLFSCVIIAPKFPTDFHFDPDDQTGKDSDSEEDKDANHVKYPYIDVCPFVRTITNNERPYWVEMQNEVQIYSIDPWAVLAWGFP